MGLVSVTDRVEVLTPLLAAGANPRPSSKKEVAREGLRGPTVRRMLRFWYRASLAGCRPHPSPGGNEAFTSWLLEGESGFLGSASERASPVKVTVFHSDEPKVAEYGVSMNRGNSYPRPGIVPGSKYCVRFRMPTNHQKTLEAVWSLALCLGGAGGRTTRAFGGLTVESRELFPGSGPEGWANALSDTIREARQTVFTADGTTTFPPPQPLVPALCTECARIWIMAPREDRWGCWKEAMDGLRTDVYDSFKKKRGDRSGQKYRIGRGGGDKRGRLPSPLSLRIQRARHQGEDSFFGIVLAWSDRIHLVDGGPGTVQHDPGNGVKIYFTDEINPNRGPANDDWTVLRDFLNGLKKDGYEVEEIDLPSWSDE